MRINKIQQNSPNFQKIRFSNKAQGLIKDAVRTNLETCTESKADYINAWKFKINTICNKDVNLFALGEKSYKDFNNECLRSYRKPDGVFANPDIVIEDIKGIAEKPADSKCVAIAYSLPQLNYKNESESKLSGNMKLFDVLDVIANALPTHIKSVLIDNSPLKKANKEYQLSDKELNKMIDNLFK